MSSLLKESNPRPPKWRRESQAPHNSARNQRNLANSESEAARWNGVRLMTQDFQGEKKESKKDIKEEKK